MIALFALSMLFVGSCPDGAMANPGTGDGAVSWLYQCPITRPFMPAG